ncbi:MAG: hypothetical protein ACE5FF_16075 [Saprospiraceae bacterium]
MKSIVTKIFGLLLLTVLTGCFEIREEVNMKAGGSGEVLLVVNLSESRDNIRKYLKLGKFETVDLPQQDDVESMLRHVRSILEGADGISNVQTRADWTNFVFRVSSRFASIEALNDAIAALSEKMDYLPVKPIEHPNYGYSGGQFRRIYDFSVNPKDYYSLSSSQRHILESARMTSIYRFEKTIREYSNKASQLSPSGKAIMLRLPISELAKGTATLANVISF